ncbi:MAG: BlaI/MecI/CopY family transcriptional regulator [Lachnospiraceae bacterium]|nr:BlaI/MecI/CopY family transcriptional regulator [Lachnospiraceae bacterium]
MQLSENEYVIMELLWMEGRPLSRAEILKGTTGRTWNPSSVHLILNNMLSKNAIKITDETKKYGRTYEAILTREDYLRQCVENGMPGKSIGEKLLGVVAALVNHSGISEQDLAALDEMLEKKREELHTQ